MISLCAKYWLFRKWLRNLLTPQDFWYFIIRRWIGLLQHSRCTSCQGPQGTYCATQSCRDRWNWTDGSISGYSNWHDQHPDWLAGAPGRNSNYYCAAIRNDSKWYSQPCLVHAPSFCKKGKHHFIMKQNVSNSYFYVNLL